MTITTTSAPVPQYGSHQIGTTFADPATIPAAPRATCGDCDLRELCTPCCGLARAQIEDARRRSFVQLSLQRGESLYLAGEPSTALYAVRQGSLKTTATLAKGCAQVTGLWISGDILGMDGIGDDKYRCTAMALEDSTVCVISFNGLQRLTAEIPHLQRHVHALMSREIVREHGMILLLGSMNAEGRLAAFLLDLSQRLSAQQTSAPEFRLNLTRDDIGSYLSLTVGTVSRLFSRFRQRGLIAVRHRFVRILERDALARLKVPVVR